MPQCIPGLQVGVETVRIGYGLDSILPTSVYIYFKKMNMNVDIVKYECGEDVNRIQRQIIYFQNLEQIQIT
jgi:hypothetical protein